MSAAATAAAAAPRPRATAIIGGVCAGLGRRLGIDPIILRVVFVAADRRRAASGSSPTCSAGRCCRPRASARAPVAAGRRAAATRGSVATGIGLLDVRRCCCCSAQWGLWFSDALVWPVVLAAAGGALIWRQSASAARSPGAGAGTRAVERRARRAAGALGRAALGVALVVGGGARSSSSSTTRWRPRATCCCRSSWSLVAADADPRAVVAAARARAGRRARRARSARRSAPRSPRTCTTRCCRRSR